MNIKYSYEEITWDIWGVTQCEAGSAGLEVLIESLELSECLIHRFLLLDIRVHEERVLQIANQAVSRAQLLAHKIILG